MGLGVQFGSLGCLGGNAAIVESLVNAHPVFDTTSVGGVPDIRVIVFQGYPVMAMLRLGTHASDGRANLHQGAVGVGLDIRNGRSIGAVQDDRAVTHHPDSHVALEGIRCDSPSYYDHQWRATMATDSEHKSAIMELKGSARRRRESAMFPRCESASGMFWREVRQARAAASGRMHLESRGATATSLRRPKNGWFTDPYWLPINSSSSTS